MPDLTMPQLLPGGGMTNTTLIVAYDDPGPSTKRTGLQLLQFAEASGVLAPAINLTNYPTSSAQGIALATIAINNGALGSAAIGVSVQAYSANLAAWSAISGTNTLYYRSGVNTFSAVTFGANLNFTGGLLKVSPRTSVTASITSPLAWNSDNFDQYEATAQSTALTFNADAGSPGDGDTMVFMITDNGTPRALTWTTGTAKSFRIVGTTLPTTTVANKLTMVLCRFNLNSNRWLVMAVSQET